MESVRALARKRAGNRDAEPRLRAGALTRNRLKLPHIYSRRPEHERLPLLTRKP